MDIRKWLSKSKDNTVGSAEARSNEVIVEEDENNSTDSETELPTSPPPTAVEEPLTSAAASRGPLPQPVVAVAAAAPRPAASGCPPGDLGTEKPAQVGLQSYPTRIIYGKNRSFNRGWFNQREWLEYSVLADAAFCFPCRKFAIGSSANSDKTFTEIGFTNWKTAMEKNKGFARHSASKEHLKCNSLWKEYSARRATGAEVSTLVNEGQLARNRKTLVDYPTVLVYIQVH